MEQIGAVAERFLEGHALPPFRDFGVIAADEDLRNFPAAKISRAGVMGEVEDGPAVGERFVESAGWRFLRAFEQAEGLVLRGGFIAERAREQTGDGVENKGGGQFTTRKDEIADGDFFGREMFGDAFVNSFVPAAEEENAIQLGVTARGILREAFACGGKQDDRGVRVQRLPGCRGASGVAKQRFDGLEQGFRLQDHAFAATKRAIVNGAMTVGGEFAQVLYVDLDDSGLAGAADDSVFEGTAEEFGEDGDEVKTHAASSLAGAVPEGLAAPRAQLGPTGD